jgi:hypothetical protein
MCQQGDTTLMQWRGKLFDVDSCIAPLVTALNMAGAYTIASCCGHGHRPGNIALEDGRELIIAPDYETGRNDQVFPDIQGNKSYREKELEVIRTAIAYVNCNYTFDDAWNKFDPLYDAVKALEEVM